METGMKNTRTTYVATAAALVVVAALVLTDLMPARAQAPQPPPLWSVKIVSPLPLPVTGSSVVSGEVAATQSGPWNVGVTGTVSVKNVDERGRNPYRVRVHCETDTGNTCFVEAPAIPAGTRLVLEQVNANVQLFSVSGIQSVDLFLKNSGHAAALPPQLVSSNGTLKNYAVNESVLVYVEAGDALIFQASSWDVRVNATAYLAGYLVDLSQ
jgi:hypothetical protein